MNNSILLHAAMLPFFLSVSGCVSGGKYRKSVEAGAALRGQLAAAENRADALEEKLAARLESAASTASDLKTSHRSEIAALEQSLLDTTGQVRAREAELEALRHNFASLNSKLGAEIAAGEVVITQLRGRLTVQMVDRLLFDSGSAKLRSTGKKTLDRVAEILKDVEGKDITVGGHTDDVPIGPELRDRFATNWDLSTARAVAVVRHLEGVSGLNAGRLVAAGYGPNRPLAPNDTLENMQKNRRIEIVLTPR